MKTAKGTQTTRKSLTVESLQQFKEQYFPVMTSDEKLKGDRQERGYGDIVAMSILDGIKRDLTALHK